MRTIRIIHAADLHLDSPYQGLSTAKAAMRREEQSLLLQRLVMLAGDEGADLMLLSGDLLDSASGSTATGEELLRWLGQAPCPVFIAPGSSDCYSERSPWAKLTLPENVTVFREKSIRMAAVPSACARIYGAAYTEPHSPPVLKGFHAERRADVYNILCMHMEQVSEEELAASGMDYAALGCGHTASGLKRSGGCHYAWPGCPEGRGFDECGEKTVSIVELGTEGCKLRTVNIASRQYRSMSLDVTGKDPLLLIHTSLPDDTVRDIYRITLTGETERAPDLGRLHQNLDEMFFALQLRDRTGLTQSLWELAGEDTLRGIFLAKLKTLMDSAKTESEKQRVEQAARWGLAALGDGEEVAVHENP